jgi:putative ABC transport system permease protein
VLRVYPREFRDEYGDEMSLLFRARSGDGLVWLWMQVLGDLLFVAARQHWGIAVQDVRYALRSWRRTPIIPGIALTALALGMGANIAVFSVMHAVLLRPLPVSSPQDLVLLREVNAARGLEGAGVSPPNYQSWTERAQSLALAAYSGQSLTWVGPEYAERLEALAPTASFLHVIGVPLRAGRWFTEEEERPGQHRVAVLSERLWRTRFGAAADVVGRQLILNGAPYAVIGVASARMTVPSDPDLWVPQVIDLTAPRRDNRYLTVIGRLRPGHTLRAAQTEMSAIAEGLADAFPVSNAGFSVSVVSLPDSLVSREVRAALMMLLVAAAMVLLIGCANVANILLSRVPARTREVAIRVALGAGGARITRQLLTESVLLSSGGAVLGLLVAAGVVQGSRRLLVELVPRVQEVTLDTTVLGFALALALLTGIGFGIAPLWHLRRPQESALLHSTGREAPSRNLFRAGLIVGQIALTSLLLVGAGLLTRSLINLQQVPLGISTADVVTAKLSLTRARLPNGAAISRFLAQLTADLQTAPGVTAAGVSSAIPLSPGALTITQARGDNDAFVTCEWRLVDREYFRALQIPLRGGRLFDAGDGADTPRVYVISEQMARALYGENDPIGRRLTLENGASGDVVGVVADVRMRSLSAPPERVIYMPPSQFGFFPLFNVVVRTQGTADAAALIRERLKAHDPTLAAYDVRSMQHWVERSASLMRIRARLVMLLGALALVLGAVGIYGVVSSLVAQRTREFGIRIALGARPGVISFGVLRQAAALSGLGLVLGLSAAGLAVDRLQELMFEVDAHDAATFASAGLIVAAITVAASLMPVRRAAAIDPIAILRTE